MKKIKKLKLEPGYKVLSRDKKGRITNIELEEFSFVEDK